MAGIPMIVVAALVLMADCAQAAGIYLTTDPAGNRFAGDTVNVSPSQSIKIYCLLETNELGNTLEVMVGYDKSDAATYGVGNDINNRKSGKLTLLSSESAIENSMPAYFDVLKNAVLDASGREDHNLYIGGRPYGFLARAATHTNAAPVGGKLMCFAFTLKNNMTASGDYQYVVISTKSGGNSYSSAWKYGTSLGESSYALKLINGTFLPTVGTSNKSVLAAIMQDAAPKYIWVLWGRVSVTGENSFAIDDGSGVIINVSATDHRLSNGDYVSVHGTLDPTSRTLTSQRIIKHN